MKPIEQLVDLLSRQPFAAMNTIKVMEYDLENFHLGMGLQKLV